jgi:hypothetical protein
MRVFPQSARVILAAAGIVSASILVSGGALAQSCLNNTNPNLVKNGGFELGSGTKIPDWTVEWNSKVDK